MDRFLRGLERRRVAGHDLQHSASVASFFLSRIDTVVDGVLEQRLAYQRWKALFSSER